MNNLNFKKHKQSENYDSQALKLLKHQKSLALNTVSFVLGISNYRALLVLQSLERFSLVEHFDRKTSYWRIKHERKRY
jgi:hypothetical protein